MDATAAAVWAWVFSAKPLPSLFLGSSCFFFVFLISSSEIAIFTPHSPAD
jgi:hypothetical protein